MILRRLSAGPFVVYQRLDKCSPAAGLTTIVGDNGTGKSCWYEAIAWCLHGETVRGSKIADAHVEVQVEVRGEVYTVERQRTPRQHKLRLACGALDLTGATPTETQRKVDAIVGTHERFCAGRVFARDLLARFGLATDRERKGLLEEVLGLEQFDRALAQCRTDMAQADVKRSVADRELAAARSQLAVYTEHLAELRARRVRSIAEVQVELDAVQAEHAKAKAHAEPRAARMGWLHSELFQLREARYRFQQLIEAHERNVRAVDQQIADIEKGCAACGRPFAPEDVAEGVRRLQANKMPPDGPGSATWDRKELAAINVKCGLYEEELEELVAESERHAAAQRVRRDRHTELKGELEIAISMAEDVGGDELMIANGNADVARLEAERDAHARVYAVLKAADQVLGLKGARVLLLSRALKRLEQEANLVLARVHPTLRLKVEVNEKDGVELRTIGAGGGDYKGCSGGQRVLVDVALVLGLAALQGGDGLLVFDEVFDSLDRRAVEAVAEYLQEISRERQVVVISHREDLVSGFRCTSRWRARADGDFSVMEDA